MSSRPLRQTAACPWPGETPMTADAAWEDESYIDYYYDDPGDVPGTLTIDPEAPLPELILIDYDPLPTMLPGSSSAAPRNVCPTWRIHRFLGWMCGGWVLRRFCGNWGRCFTCIR